MPSGKWHQEAIGLLITKFAKDPNNKPYRGEQLLRFIMKTAEDFAADVTKRGKVAVYRGYTPEGCLQWLNEVERTEEARRVG